MKEKEYEMALQSLKGTDLAKALPLIDGKLQTLPEFEGIGQRKKIMNWFDELSTKVKTLKGGESYKKLLAKSANPDETKLSLTEVNNLRAYLLVCYTHKGVYLQYMLAEGVPSFSRTSQNEFIVRGPNEEETHVYDFFYWRTTRDDIGIGKIKFFQDWRKAEVVYHYLTREKEGGQDYALLAGDVVWHGPHNLYIRCSDAMTDKGEPIGVQVFLSLYVSEFVNKRQYISGVFASSNRDLHHPVCGMVVMQRSASNNLFASDYITQLPGGGGEKKLHNIPASIYYAVSGQRIKVKAEPVLKDTMLPSVQEKKHLSGFVGTYRVYQPKPDKSVQQMNMTIYENGKVTLIRKKDTKVGFVVFCDNVLIIKIRDQKEEDELWRQYFILEKETGSQSVKGIAAGYDSDQQIVSARVFLSQRDPALINAPMVSQTADAAYFDALAREDPAALQFLLDTSLEITDAVWVRHLDSMSDRKGSSRKLHHSFASLFGAYNLFFLTKLRNSPLQGNIDNQKMLPEQPMQLIQMPLTIGYDGVSIQFGGRTIEGTITSDGLHQLSVQFEDPTFWASLLLSIPMPGTHQAASDLYHYGILSRINSHEPESSAIVLHRERDEAYRVYREFRQIGDLMEIEQRYQGLVSFLFGDWSRFIRMPDFEKTSVTFQPKYATFRRTFFAAACHYALAKNWTLCSDNLKRAFRHGFAMYQFSQLTPTDADFPPELHEERGTLYEALTDVLTDEKIKRYVLKRWKFDLFPVR